MPQFDVYRNPAGPGYLLDCQADHLSGLSTRVVVPLLAPEDAPKPSHGLNPPLRLGDEELLMMTHFAAAIPKRALGLHAGSLAGDHIRILSAFDMLLTGY